VLHERGFGVVIPDNPAVFDPEGLSRYAVVVFLETTGDVLDPEHEAALRSWVEAGGGWVGVHSALDTEYGWDFYATLAGARFASHPPVQAATVRIEDADHPATAHLPAAWARTDEWYDLQSNPRGSVHVLATVDESTYTGGLMGDHPIVWCRPVGAGAAFVTAMGHTDESWADPRFVDHVASGIESVTRPGTCSSSS
jgi:type 1 glutamine amidotransferase